MKLEQIRQSGFPIHFPILYGILAVTGKCLHWKSLCFSLPVVWDIDILTDAPVATEDIKVKAVCWDVSIKERRSLVP